MCVLAFFRLQGIKQVTDATRALNKRIGNPVMMKLAGRRYWFAGTIHHTGRHSGREYATPVWAVPTPDGFLISLPFGEGVDWLKNVLAAGRATIETRGETWEVVDPEVIGRETAWSLLPRRARSATFQELRHDDVRSIQLLRRWVNKGEKKGQDIDNLALE